MIKKILPIVLCLVLMFGISASATNTTDTESANPPTVSEETPMQGERQGGGRGGMRTPPQGENIPNGEMPPAMPEGATPPNMPEGEMAPPQENRNPATENSQQAQTENGNSTENAPNDIANENTNRMPSGDFGGGMGGQGSGFGGMNGGMPENAQNTETTSEAENTNGVIGFMKTYTTPITAVIMLVLAFIFVIFYKRKNY